MKKERLDRLLVERGFFTSREQAKRVIMAGLVYINQEKIDKVGTRIPVEAEIEVRGKEHPYVSRGGLKLEKAIAAFSLTLDQRIMLDIGASTGGFTDCALQHGAACVYAVDVGYGQLAWKLRQDPRVVVIERTNFRYFESQLLDRGQPDLATIDVSFISLAHIFPKLSEVLPSEGEVVALVKPQFEAGREQVGKKGIVRDPDVHKQVLWNTLQMAEQWGFSVRGIAVSPIRGGKGNIEFLAYLRHQSVPSAVSMAAIQQVVKEAHTETE